MYVTDHKGNKFASQGEMCEFYDIPLSLFRQRLQKGWSLKRALETPLMRFIDHEGNNFKSSAEMCKAWCIPHDVFKSRIRDGWALKDALETPVTINLGRFQVRDHRGNMFKSIEEMCKAYDITYVTFSHRLKLGWTLKDALETPVRVPLEAYWVTDYKGNKFKSKKEMCKAYGINYSTFKSRMRLGWALKDALETPVKEV